MHTVLNQRTASPATRPRAAFEFRVNVSHTRRAHLCAFKQSRARQKPRRTHTRLHGEGGSARHLARRRASCGAPACARSSGQRWPFRSSRTSPLHTCPKRNLATHDLRGCRVSEAQSRQSRTVTAVHVDSPSIAGQLRNVEERNPSSAAALPALASTPSPGNGGSTLDDFHSVRET